MDRQTINFIRSVLPDGRTVYYGFPDRYALLLLESAIGKDGRSISEIKNTRFAPLLNKPCVRRVLADLGGTTLRPAHLLRAWPTEPEAYRLTLGTWPDLSKKPTPNWDQVTRWGWNIVLQLNLSSTHKRQLEQHIPDWRGSVRYSAHPIARGDELTLAWSRIDLDFETSEALIEEIQSDWVRMVRWRAASEYEQHEAWSKYHQNILKPQTRKWPENMLTATLWFLMHELGLKHVFYHTHETGNQLKRIVHTAPPRSIYTDLPRKFCFEVSHNGPLFIRDSARRHLRQKFTDPRTKWYVLHV